MLTPKKTDGRFIGIKADGLFHEKVSEGTEGAELRKYELQDGTKGEKWELLYKNVRGVHITKIEFEDSDYGENILTTLSDGENEVIWAEGTNTNFGTDYMKKLPNINFAEKVDIVPYAFTDENTGKDKRGITIYQNGEKVQNFFWKDGAVSNGMPFVSKEDGEKYDKDDWKVHFISVKKFLTNYVKENIIPKFEGVVVLKSDEVEYPSEEINPEDVPF